jgi:hypothetical protein
MAAWIARDLDVRRAFDLVIWVTMSQEPQIAKLQSLAMIQATGEDLPKGMETSPAEAKELLTQALRGRKALMILDDLWGLEEEEMLNAVDFSAGSKLLVTTRIRGIISDAEQVEVGLPGLEDAAQLLLRCDIFGPGAMSFGWELCHLAEGCLVTYVVDVLIVECRIRSAGWPVSAEVPPEAYEVADLCGYLPLALDIAGKMLKSLSLDSTDLSSWRDVPKTLAEQMKSVNDATPIDETIGYKIIGAGLLKIPQQDQQAVATIFSVFAVVAEDTHVPMSAFRTMFGALSEDGGACPSELQLRMWLQMLIDRSLVLGSWERPQLHDIVREHAIAQHSEEKLISMHRAVIDAFAACKPRTVQPVTGGIPAWQNQPGNASASYVRTEIHQHMKAAMMKASPLETPPFARRCLSVIPSVDPVEETQGDDIARAVVYALGVDRLLHLRAESLEQENFFLAQNCHLGVIAIQVPQKGLACITDNGWAQQMHEISERSSGQGRPAHISQVQWEWWILTTRLLALQLKVMLPNLFDFMSADQFDQWIEQTGEMIKTFGICNTCPHFRPIWTYMRTAMTAYMEGDLDTSRTIMLRMWQGQLQQAIADDATIPPFLTHQICVSPMEQANISAVFSFLEHPDWDWDILTGERLQKSLEAHTRTAEDCFRDLSRITQDILVHQAVRGSMFAVVALRGDVDGASACFDIQAQLTMQLCSAGGAWSQPAFKAGMLLFMKQLMEFFHYADMIFASAVLLGRRAEALELWKALGLADWAGLSQMVDNAAMVMTPNLLVPRGAKQSMKDAPFCSESVEWRTRFMYLLLEPSPPISVAELQVMLPSPAQLHEWDLKAARKVKGSYCAFFALYSASLCCLLRTWPSALLRFAVTSGCQITSCSRRKSWRRVSARSMVGLTWR